MQFRLIVSHKWEVVIALKGIRTYNFPQGRMTDHRINLTLYKLDEIMQGEIGDILDQLGAHHTAELLKQQSELN